MSSTPGSRLRWGFPEPAIPQQLRRPGIATRPSGRRAVLSGVLLWTLCSGCGSGPRQTATTRGIHYTAVAEGEVWFRNSSIQIRFDRELYCGVFFRQAGRLLALSHNPPDPTLARPSHFIAVEGAEILDFYVDYQNIGLSEVRGRFGPGKRLNITGFGVTPDGILIEKTMVVELYEAYPDTAMIWAVYRNKDLERPLRITRITNQFFRMDASLTDPQAPRHALQCFHHDRLVHGPVTPPLLDPDFARIVTTASPGFARVAFWNRAMGMTVASLPPEAGTLTIPVRTARDQRVEVSFHYDVDRILEPEEELVCPKGFVMVYSGDYRSGLARQKAMMGGEG